MPTNRPAAPATLSGSNAVALAALAVWLSDADASVPDLAGIQSALTRNGVTFGTGVAGGEFTPNTTPGALEGTTAAVINTYPIVLFAVFSRAGSKSGGSGFETICSIGDTTNDSGGLYAMVGIDDGTQATNGDILLRFHTQLGGNEGLANLGAYTPGVVHAVVGILYDASGTHKIASFIDGALVSDAAPASDPGAFAGDSISKASAMELRRGAAAGILQASTSLSMALWGFSQTKLTNSDYTSWSGDKWTILNAPSGVGRRSLLTLGCGS